MCDVSADEDDRLAEHADGSNARHENVVHAAEFHVDFQAQIRESLRRRLVHVLRLNALRCQTDQCVAHTLHFGVDGCFARQDDHDELQAVVGALEESKHRLDLFDARGVFAKTGLTNDGHARIVGYPLQLLREGTRERERQARDSTRSRALPKAYRSEASLQFRCGAKQAMAHVRISMPV